MSTPPQPEPDLVPEPSPDPTPQADNQAGNPPENPPGNTAPATAPDTAHQPEFVPQPVAYQQFPAQPRYQTQDQPQYQPRYAPAPFQIPAMNQVWSEEDPRHPAASIRRRFKHDPYWWIWPVGSLALGLVLGVLCYGLIPRPTMVVCVDGTSCGPAPVPVDWGIVIIYLACAWGAFGSAFLLPHRWVWLWLRIPLSLTGIGLAIACGTAAGA